ncbi:MAG TPA: LytR C-terminal domain-containing protein [Miltoncostaeaceae bacterium]|nr:LytR C-terminal domain-containing protein [Miltoncostaeaceae bacterium]
MSSRTRPPDLDLDWEEPARPARRRPPAPPPRQMRRFGLPIVGAALFIGLVVGYLVSAGSSGTTTITETKTVTAPAVVPPPVVASGEASRAGIALVVLNGSDEAGLAGRTAEEARTLGYEEVTEGNAPAPEATDRVLYQRGAAAEARQVADDLGLPDPVRLAASDPIADAVDPSAQVIVALGPTGLTAPDAGATGAGAAAEPEADAAAEPEAGAAGADVTAPVEVPAPEG